jgi:predicted enzyme related to lactoylglutathione lyase
MKKKPSSVGFTHCAPVLPVTDVAATQEYYRDVFGFTIEWRNEDLFGGVTHGDIMLFFEKWEAPPRGLTVMLHTDDADAVHRAVTAAGAVVVDPIATRSGGMREFTVEDSNGHYLRIGHVDESQADYSDFE